MLVQKDTLEKRRALLGNEHPLTLVGLNNMGMLLRSIGSQDEALAHLQEALAGAQKTYGGLHPKTLACIKAVAFQLQASGRLEESEQYYREALEGSRTALGGNSLDTLRNILDVGIVLVRSGKYEDALGFYREYTDLGSQLLGESADEVLEAKSVVGLLLKVLGIQDEAKTVIEEVVAAYESKHGATHELTLGAVDSLASVLLKRSELAEALELLLPAYNSSIENHGPENTTTQMLRNRLLTCLKALHASDPTGGFDKQALEILGEDLFQEGQ